MMERFGFVLAAVAVIALAAVFASRKGQGQGAGGAFTLPDGWDFTGDGGPVEQDQNTSFLEDVAVTFAPSTYAPVAVPVDVAAQNVRAFLDMIAFAEGTAGHGDDGYNVLFGYGTFDSYADHPRVFVPYGNTSTSAAGRYQFLSRTWDGLKSKLGLPDFGHESQDAGAVELIRQRGALADVQAGRVVQAIGKVAKIWASLPGAGYGQPERRQAALLDAYAQAGGQTEVQA